MMFFISKLQLKFVFPKKSAKYEVDVEEALEVNLLSHQQACIL